MAVRGSLVTEDEPLELELLELSELELAPELEPLEPKPELDELELELLELLVLLVLELASVAPAAFAAGGDSLVSPQARSAAVSGRSVNNWKILGCMTNSTCGCFSNRGFRVLCRDR